MNVLVIVVDDYGKDYCLPWFQQDWAVAPRQPFLESIARSSVMFDNFFSTPICSTSRAELETGRLGFRYGVGSIVQPTQTLGRLSRAETEFRLANLLKKHRNYNCGYFGKDHITDDSVGRFGPQTGGFDKFVGIRGNIGVPSGNGVSHDNWRQYNVPPNTVPTSAQELTDGVTTYTCVKTTQDAAAWINDSGNAGKNWLCMVALSAVHSPYTIPPTTEQTYTATPQYGFTPTATPPQSDEYLSMCQAFDKSIGEMFNSIQRGGNFDPSKDLMIFVSDNGTPDTWTQAPFNPEHAKGRPHRYGTCVPMFVLGATNIGATRRSRELVTFADIYATILDVCGVDINVDRPVGMHTDGISFANVLRNPSGRSLRRWAYRATFPDAGSPAASYQRGISSRDFDLLRYTNGSGTQVEEFYDVVADPYEANNLLAAGKVMTLRQSRGLSELRVALAKVEAANALGAAAPALDATVF